MPRPTFYRMPALRNIRTAVAILGFGLATGALLGEASLMNFSLARPDALQPHGVSANVNGYLVPSESMGRSRRTAPQRRGIIAHHTGI